MPQMYKYGLTSSEAEAKLSEFGKNQLRQKKKQSVIGLFLEQFKDVMVIILLAATAISAFMGEIYDAVTIISIVLLDAILGFIQEYRTEKTMEALEKLTSPTAKVIRNGERAEIDASLVVPGDILLLDAGDRIPCDGKPVELNGLWCDEAILTGESEAVKKNPDGMVYMGTSVTRGNAVIKCTETGMSTKMGQMSALIDEAGKDQTPLQKKLSDLGKALCFICLAVCFLVALAGIIRGEPIFDMLLTGITIAIAAIPEGLPATVTIALALAVRRMLKLNALVHKLHSVETLGCTTVICTDKTGTLTENRMSVTKIWADEQEYDLSGSLKSVNTRSSLKKQGGDLTKPLNELFYCGVLCNNSEISISDGEISAAGDPTESAILIAAQKAGIDPGELRRECRRLSEIPFESETKQMSVTVVRKAEEISFTKGAPDIIIKKMRKHSHLIRYSPAYSLRQTRAVRAYRKIRIKGLKGDGILRKLPRQRLHGIFGAYGNDGRSEKGSKSVCCGSQARRHKNRDDNRRPQAYRRGCSKGSRHTFLSGMVIGKDELDGMSDKELARIIDRVCVFARVDPKDKLRIVAALKQKGHIVAMTGDGVNDAPAIKEANIGVAMGKSGTDACKQAADLILTDDNFSTLCEAVKQGRTVYSNIRKFVRYLISCNIGEVMVMLLSIVSGLPVILLPTQILLVNLVTDGLPAIALGLEKSEKTVMELSPKRFSGNFFSGGFPKNSHKRHTHRRMHSRLLHILAQGRRKP